MFRQILDLVQRNRSGGRYGRSSSGGGGLLGRILGGSSGRGRYDDRHRYDDDRRRYDDDRRRYDDERSRSYGRRRRGDDDDDDDD